MTRLLVLGLLDVQPMSGYDIQQTLSMLDAERWGGILVGSIYHALKKLEQEKYIELTGIEQTGHRQKAVYQTTQQGKEHLKSLISDSLRTSSVLYPTTLYSGLSFIDKIPPDQARRALEEQKQLLDEEYRALEHGLKEKEAALQDDIPQISKITFDNMFAIIRQQQQFIESLLDIFRQQD